MPHLNSRLLQLNNNLTFLVAQLMKFRHLPFLYVHSDMLICTEVIMVIVSVSLTCTLIFYRQILYCYRIFRYSLTQLPCLEGLWGVPAAEVKRVIAVKISRADRLSKRWLHSTVPLHICQHWPGYIVCQASSKRYTNSGK